MSDISENIVGEVLMLKQCEIKSTRTIEVDSLEEGSIIHLYSQPVLDNLGELQNQVTDISMQTKKSVIVQDKFVYVCPMGGFFDVWDQGDYLVREV